MDALAKLSAFLTGVSLVELKRREYDWTFAFPGNVGLTVECPWRIVVGGSIAFADTDSGHKFGLPKSLNGEEVVRRLFNNKTVERVTIRADTSDMSIHFSEDTVLEFFNLSCGYEAWQFNAPGILLIAAGGGNLTVFTDPSAGL